MTEWLGGLLQGDFGTAPTNVPIVLLGLLLSFLSGHAVAWCYVRTHSGLSFSRTYVNSLILIPMIVSMVMVVLANNLVTAFGMMAVFAIVRFRNVLRDTLDTTFILVVIAAGMACGTQKFATALLAVAIFVLVVFYLHWTAFGRRHRFDLIVNLRWLRPLSELPELRALFARHTRRAQCWIAALAAPLSNSAPDDPAFAREEQLMMHARSPGGHRPHGPDREPTVPFSGAGESAGGFAGGGGGRGDAEATGGSPSPLTIPGPSGLSASALSSGIAESKSISADPAGHCRCRSGLCGRVGALTVGPDSRTRQGPARRHSKRPRPWEREFGGRALWCSWAQLLSELPHIEGAANHPASASAPACMLRTRAGAFSLDPPGLARASRPWNRCRDGDNCPRIEVEMREGQPSFTAASVAVWRGCGPWLPANMALCDDPFAHAFARGLWAPVVRAADAHPRVAGQLLLASPLRRLALWIQIRTRVIDDVLLGFAQRERAQIVLLGAGFDARAARFAEALGGCRFFEVDHPATQARKRQVIAARGIRSDRVQYIPWDFERQDLQDLRPRLEAHGLDCREPTLTIWEGVIMYLSEAAISATVDCVRSFSGEGSQLVFNYTERSFLHRRRALNRFTRWVGEPVRFGWDPAELPGWLGRHGFGLRWDECDAELAARLLPADVARGIRWKGGRVALAEPHA